MLLLQSFPVNRIWWISFISSGFNFDVSNVLLFVNIFVTDISFFVRVPVLSVQITSIEPMDSTTFSFLTRAFFVAMTFAPIASTRTRIAGRPSGIAATARDIEVSRDW